jgi:hypothetical protein
LVYDVNNTKYLTPRLGERGDNQEETDDSVEYEDQSNITFLFYMKLCCFFKLTLPDDAFDHSNTKCTYGRHCSAIETSPIRYSYRPCKKNVKREEMQFGFSLSSTA